MPSPRASRSSKFPRQTLTRYDLYELVVQIPSIQARFLRAIHGGAPRVLAEDFSGPASIARAWLELDADHHAIANDRDPEPLEHAKLRAQEQLEDGIARFTLRTTDVMAAGDHADIIAAFNFAACELHERAALVTYLRRALYRLNANGVFVADLYGGVDAYSPGESTQTVKTDAGSVKYTWEQRDADPLSGRVCNAMHFAGPALKKEMRDAFVYDWRLWSVPELRDALREAGFKKTEVYADYGGAMDDEGNLIVRPASWDGAVGQLGDQLEENWVVYVVGRV